MIHINVAVLNQSTEASDKTIKSLTSALQKQVTQHFAPVWGIDATLKFVPKSATPNPEHWQLIFLDTADQAGALGYHETTATGLPLGKVFIRTTELDGGAWSVTASHELLELLVDPYANLTVFRQSNNTAGRLYAYEVADAVEADADGYAIGSFQMSNFVFPSWFEDGLTGVTQFDYQKQLTGPFQLRKGGYIGIFDIPNKTGWQQLLADKPKPQKLDSSAPECGTDTLRFIPMNKRKKSLL